MGEFSSTGGERANPRARSRPTAAESDAGVCTDREFSFPARDGDESMLAGPGRWQARLKDDAAAPNEK